MATRAFLAAMESEMREVVTLAEVVLKTTAGGTVTLSLATRDCDTSDGRHWVGAITDPGVVHSPGDYLATDVPLCTGQLTLAKECPVYAGLTVRQMLGAGYVWIGSQVTLWMWEMTTGWADRHQTLPGEVLSLNLAGETAELALRQRTGWNGPINPSVVERALWPNAPEEAVGAALPICYGRLQSPPARRPTFTTNYPLNNALERFRPPSRVSRAVLVDPGRGDGRAIVRFASHACGAISDQNTAVNPSMDMNGTLARLVACTPMQDANGVGITIPDNLGVGYISAYPVALADWNTSLPTKQGDDWSAIMDPGNEQTFCRFTYTDPVGATPSWWFNQPGSDDLGTLVNHRLLMLYRSSPGMTGYMMYVLYLDQDEVYSSGSLPLSSDIALFELAIPTTGDQGQPFFGWQTGRLTLQLGYHYGEAALGEYVDVFAAAIESLFIPKQETLGQRRTVSTITTRPTSRGQGGSARPYQVFDILPPQQQLVGKFFTNLEGYQDDASGTITGAAYGLIERPADIARHMLTVYGGEAADRFETRPARVGSFYDARHKLKTGAGTDMICAASIADQADVMTALSWLAASTLTWPHLSPHDDKWRLHVWQANPACEWPTPIKRAQWIEPPTIEVTNAAEIVTAVTLSYGRDDHGGGYSHQTSLSPSRSSAGYGYLNLPDQTMEVVAGASQQIDMYDSPAYSATATLEAGDHTFLELLEQMHFRIRAAGFFSHLWAFGFGGLSTYRTNMLDVSVGGTTYSAGIATTAEPTTMEEYALAVQAALNGNVPPHDFTVTYLWTTHQFRIVRAGGAFTMLFGSGPFQAYTAAAALGFTCEDRAASAVGDGSYYVESYFGPRPGVFAMSSNAEFSLLWRSGPNGYLAHTPPLTAHAVLGFSTYDDTPYDKWATGVVPKGRRQAALAQAAQRYIAASATGPSRRDLTLEGRFLNDDDTALEVRNRAVDLKCQPLIRISGLLQGVIGIERGAVVALDNDHATLAQHPDPDGNGSWAGKGFVVVETVQHQGPDNDCTEVVLVSRLRTTETGWDYGWGEEWGN
jgi:hypothetical protein